MRHAMWMVVGVLCLTGVPFEPLSAQNSPLAGADADGEGYPDASEWPKADYSRPPAGTKLQLSAAGMARAAAIGFSAAAAIQADLPQGMTLGIGTPTLVSAGGVGIGESAARTAGQPDPMRADQQEVAAGPAPAASAEDPSRKWFIHYGVNYGGIPVAKSSDVLAIIKHDGQVLYVRKRNLPKGVNATEPSVAADTAIEVARDAAGEVFAGGDPAVSAPSVEVWVDTDLNGHLTWTFTLESKSLTEPAGRRYWISAVGEPQVLHWENTLYHTHFGAVTGTLWTASPLQATANRPLQDMTVTRVGGGGGSQTTDPDGRYGFPGGGGTATMSGNLSGPSSVIQNLAGAVMVRSNTGTPVNAVDLNLDASGEFETAQVSAFYWTNVAYRFAQSILDPLPGQPFKNLPTRVNINASCNAFWNGSSINFFRAGGSCPNTAYPDVVLHEYGHGIDHWRGGIVDGGYSEGFGDACALLVTRQSCVGRDFFGAGTCLRDATDVNLWPPSPGEGVHSIGRRYGQFTWQLVQELQKTYSEDESFALASRLVLAAAAGNPSDIPDAVLLSFIADDDDGNLNNGAPHFKELAAAADSRNIPRPPDPIAGRLGFVWAYNPTASSYSPTPIYSFNSGGGPITITRISTGRYRVRFAGLGGHGTPGGHVQVTAYGPGSETAKVQVWSSAGSNFDVYVRCFNSSGSLVDTRYNVFVRWP